VSTTCIACSSSCSEADCACWHFSLQYTAVCVTTSGMVVCGTNNGVIRGWLVSEVRVLRHPCCGTAVISFSERCLNAVLCVCHGVGWWWQANEFTLAVTIPLPADASTVWSLLAGPKGTIVAGLSGGTLVVYDSNGKLVQRLVGHSGHVNSLAWMADPSYLVREREGSCGTLFCLLL